MGVFVQLIGDGFQGMFSGSQRARHALLPAIQQILSFEYQPESLPQFGQSMIQVANSG